MIDGGERDRVVPSTSEISGQREQRAFHLESSRAVRLLSCAKTCTSHLSVESFCPCAEITHARANVYASYADVSVVAFRCA